MGKGNQSKCKQVYMLCVLPLREMLSKGFQSCENVKDLLVTYSEAYDLCETKYFIAIMPQSKSDIHQTPNGCLNENVNLAFVSYIWESCGW